MSAFNAIVVAAAGAGLGASATAMTSTLRELQRRARRRAGASARVHDIVVTFEDGHMRSVHPTPEAIKAVKQAIQRETAAGSKKTAAPAAHR